jgi:hypothetical protein
MYYEIHTVKNHIFYNVTLYYLKFNDLMLHEIEKDDQYVRLVHLYYI